ncbi:NmrA family protein [Hypoxylon cercidicola]|nr:NmrA family protein [Hypoxylon cercidicola]
MAPSTSCVFVCGVTGNQGGSLAEHLLQMNWDVHATVRDLKSPRALALVTAGAKLTQGNWDNEEALRISIKGCSKLFLNLVPDINDLDHERRQAVSILSIAKEAGVKQIISSTSLGVSLLDAKGHLAGVLKPGTIFHTFIKVKKDIEILVLNWGFESCTFLRPGYFMANFLEPLIEGYTEILTDGTWSTVFKTDTRLGLIDHDDIAKFAVAAFQDPERFNARVIGLVSEFLTPQETLDSLGKAMGRQRLKAISLEDGALTDSFSNPYVKGDKCLEYMTELVDMQELDSTISLTSFEDFLEREKANVRKMQC